MHNVKENLKNTVGSSANSMYIWFTQLCLPRYNYITLKPKNEKNTYSLAVDCIPSKESAIPRAVVGLRPTLAFLEYEND